MLLRPATHPARAARMHDAPEGDAHLGRARANAFHAPLLHALFRDAPRAPTHALAKAARHPRSNSRFRAVSVAAYHPRFRLVHPSLGPCPHARLAAPFSRRPSLDPPALPHLARVRLGSIESHSRNSRVPPCDTLAHDAHLTSGVTSFQSPLGARGPLTRSATHERSVPRSHRFGSDRQISTSPRRCSFASLSETATRQHRPHEPASPAVLVTALALAPFCPGPHTDPAFPVCPHTQRQSPIFHSMRTRHERASLDEAL